MHSGFVAQWSILLTFRQFSFVFEQYGADFLAVSALGMGGTKGRPMSRRSIDLRDQADKCRQHANKIGDAQTQEELRKVAAEYIDRATSIESFEIRMAGKPKRRIPR